MDGDGGVGGDGQGQNDGCNGGGGSVDGGRHGLGVDCDGVLGVRVIMAVFRGAGGDGGFSDSGGRWWVAMGVAGVGVAMAGGVGGNGCGLWSGWPWWWPRWGLRLEGVRAAMGVACGGDGNGCGRGWGCDRWGFGRQWRWSRCGW